MNGPTPPSELQPKLQDALGNRYTVERPLGAGGMAYVFLAQDVKHHRPVAVKVLRPEWGSSLGAERFLREIEIAAKLQHPHVLPLYDSGSAGDLLYYVMPYVEGESLEQRIAREGQLPLKDTLEIAAEVASALQHAHEHGIVHRDIKPANVLLSGGHAMVADFGIARAISAAGGASLTQAGMSVGTPTYMSPEQATGSADEVDARTDVYSLGCVLFEMLTGKPPYEGSTFTEILARALSGEVPKLRVTRPAAPAWLDDVLARSLAKEPKARFQTAGAMASALEQRYAERARRPVWQHPAVYAAAVVAVVFALFWWLRPTVGGAAVRADAEVIAVLPFTSSGANLELLGEGMVDLLSTNLNGVGGIRTVDPRTVLNRWRRRADGSGIDLAGALDVGRDVNAASILLGSVVGAGTDVRLSAELYSVRGEQLARVSLDGSADSVLPLVDSLSLHLVREIWRSSEPLPNFRVSGVTTGSLDAIRSYLAGMQHYRHSQWDSAIVDFERAVALDSTFALAQMHLGITHAWVSGQGTAQAMRHSAAAVANGDRLPSRERLLVNGHHLFEQGKIEALDSLRLYAARYPDDATGLFLLADAQFHALPLLGLSVDDALQSFERVLALDSTLTPALVHPIELSLLMQDSTRFRRYMGQLAARGGDAAPGQLRPYEGYGSLVWRDRPVSTDELIQLAESDPRMIVQYLVAMISSDRILPDSVVAAVDRLYANTAPQDPRWAMLVNQKVLALLATGRHAAAKVFLDSIGEASRNLAFALSLAGGLTYPEWPGSDELSRTLRGASEEQPGLASIQLLLALTRGDTAGARTLVAAVDTASWQQPELRALFRGGVAWFDLTKGDTAAALATLEQALRDVGYAPNAVFQGGPLRYALVSALARNPATRHEVLDRITADYGLLAVYGPNVTLLRAEIHEADGNREAAAVSYTNFLRLWEHADPSLQHLNARARAGLARVTGEPTS